MKRNVYMKRVLLTWQRLRWDRVTPWPPPKNYHAASIQEGGQSDPPRRSLEHTLRRVETSRPSPSSRPKMFTVFFYKFFVLKVVRNFLLEFRNYFQSENFRWTFCAVSFYTFSVFSLFFLCFSLYFKWFFNVSKGGKPCLFSCAPGV